MIPSQADKQVDALHLGIDSLPFYVETFTRNNGIGNLF